jgi:DNA mismatch repair protein MutS
VSAREWKDQIIFLRKIVSGRSDRSYGIQVARLAGLPATVVTRAQEILAGLERDEASRGGRPTLSASSGGPSTAQLGLFATPVESSSTLGKAVLSRLEAIDIDDTTPRQALELLAELKKLSEDG